MQSTKEQLRLPGGLKMEMEQWRLWKKLQREMELQQAHFNILWVKMDSSIDQEKIQFSFLNLFVE